MLPSQLGRGRPASCGRGPARFCRVSRLKAVGEVVGLRAFACRSARWGVAAARAGDVWRARARRCITAATLQRVCVAGLCMPPRARKTQRFCAARAAIMVLCNMAKPLCRWDAARCLNQLCFLPVAEAEVESQSGQAVEVFRPNATHASAGASLRVAGAL